MTGREPSRRRLPRESGSQSVHAPTGSVDDGCAEVRRGAVRLPIRFLGGGGYSLNCDLSIKKSIIGSQSECSVVGGWVGTSGTRTRRDETERRAELSSQSISP